VRQEFYPPSPVAPLSKEPSTQLMGQCCYRLRWPKNCDCALCNYALYHAVVSCLYANASLCSVCCDSCVVIEPFRNKQSMQLGKKPPCARRRRMDTLRRRTRGSVLLTFFKRWDIICHVPPHFIFRFCIWRGFKTKSYVCHMLCEEIFMFDVNSIVAVTQRLVGSTLFRRRSIAAATIAKLMLKRSLVCNNSQVDVKTEFGVQQ